MANPVIFGPTSAWYGGGYDWTGAINKMALKVGRAEVDDARCGDDIDAKFPGILMPSAEMSGFFAAGADEPDPTLFDRIKQTFTGWPNSFRAEDASGVWYTLMGCPFAYELGAAHGEALPFMAKLLARSGQAGRVYRQSLGLAKALRTATTTGTGLQLGFVTATQRLVSTVHLFAITGGSLTVTIESDATSGFPTPVVRITHAAMTTAPNREVVEHDNTIGADDWYRVVATYTPGTNFTAAVLLSIENRV